MNKFYTFKVIIIILIISYILPLNPMEKKPYHHIYKNGKLVGFRNLPGVPTWGKKKWPWRKFSEEKKKINTNVPSNYYFKKTEVLENLEKVKNEDYIMWLGHNSWLLSINKTTILFDPVLGKKIGPMSLIGPTRYLEAALSVAELPKIDVIIISHNHFDHTDYFTLKKIESKKDIEVIVPLRLGNFFKKLGYSKITELDWEKSKTIKNITITSQIAIHWSKRSLFSANDTLWCSYLLESNGKKIWLGGDSGYIKNIFDDIGKKVGEISLAVIGIGAYNFTALGFEKTLMHTSPEEALALGKSINAKKIIGSHFLGFVLSLEPVLEPAKRFKENAERFGYSKEDAMIFKIGEIRKLSKILK